MKALSSVVTSIPRSGIRELMDLAWSTPGVIHLEVGEPDFATPDHVLQAAARAGADGYTKYTPNAGIPEVREAFAAKVSARNGFIAAPDNVVVTVGAINALFQSIMVLCDPGDAVLIPDPGWPNYEIVARAVGVRPVRYPLVPSAGFVPDLEALETAAATPGAKAMIMNSPGNPTGAVFDRTTQEQMLEIAHRHDLWLISDECYEDIVFDGPHVSPAAVASHERVISVYSMSKSYAMTGWRVGYAVAPLEVAENMAKLAEAVTACVTGVAQKAAQAAVEGDQSCVAEMRDAYRRRRDLAAGLLESAGMLVFRPQGAFYIMVDVSAAQRGGYDLCRWLVTEHGVAAAPGETFGPNGVGLIRVSLSAADEDVRTGVERIVAALATV
ncbi:MAG: aspartate/prephenate aminotransferase [Acidimicrobiia bacterium]|nr:MAG: aspartate/prephenate aminotransferase [Acidimicrobiia bacterium]